MTGGRPKGWTLTLNRAEALRLIGANQIHATRPAWSDRPLTFMLPQYLEGNGSVARAVRDALRLGLARPVDSGATPLFEHFRIELTPEGKKALID